MASNFAQRHFLIAFSAMLNTQLPASSDLTISTQREYPSKAREQEMFESNESTLTQSCRSRVFSVSRPLAVYVESL